MYAPQSDDAVRADIYRLLSRLLAAPPSEEILALISGIEPAAEHDDVMAVAVWQTLKLAAERATQGAVDDEFHDLFIGIGRGELMPYGSWYVTGFLMDRPLAALRTDLASLGIERRDGVHEPEDHVAALCETMDLIIRAGEAIPGHVQNEFFNKHIAPWMDSFFDDLQDAKTAHFYRAVGQLGARFLRFEKMRAAPASRA